MKPAPFAYEKPGTMAELFGLLAEHGADAAILAGGQSLMATMNMRLSAPEILVDINGLKELSGISVSADKLSIGALTRHCDVASSEDVAARGPLIHLAMPYVAHAAIRNRGTFGGSVALADPASEIPACMVCLDGEIEITGAMGVRCVPAATYFKGLYETDLQEGEIVTAVHVPVLGDGERHAFDEITRRHGDYAMAGLAASASVSGTTLSNVRLAYFGVAGTPVLAIKAGAALEGRINDACISAAQNALDSDLDPFDDIGCSAATKLHLAKVLLDRMVRRLVAVQ